MTCSRAMWKVNRSSRSSSLLSVVILKRRMPSAGWPPSSGSIVPRPAISVNSSTRLSERSGASSGPTCSSSWRNVDSGAAAAADGVAAGAANAAARAGVAETAIVSPATSARIWASSSVVSTASPLPPFWWRASCARSASPDCSSTSTIGAVGASSWRRSLSSSVSIWCVSSAASAKPNVAAPPLTECAQRKMEFSSSSSAASMSISSSCCSMRSRFSPASSKKTW